MTHAIELGLFYFLIYFALSGVDDLSIDLRLLWAKLRDRWTGRNTLPSQAALRGCEARRIAVIVPLWQEADVIGAMVETNLAHIEYANYEFFLGAYPNDHATLAEVNRLAEAHERVHVVVCSRPGPTSKADCLNHLYRALELRERQSGEPYEIVVLHDAEDVLHPTSLALMNWYSRSHGMVQVPVLPFPTSAANLVYGVYCDEFAEFLARDMTVRGDEGGFLPSNGVGTAFRREYLEQLRDAQNGVLFDEECLTEDYEIGLKLSELGCAQIFLPLTCEYGDLLATREYFPRTLKTAIRQRTRWISGQCLQSWERHGWPLRPAVCYWFWRDRKGLWGNYFSFAALLLLAVSAAAWVAPSFTGLGPWLWVTGSVPAADILYPLCTLLTLERIAVRMALVARIYGLPFALGVPLRMILSTWINVHATTSAISRFAMARWQRKRLGWMKTEHAFPLLPAAVRAEAQRPQEVAVPAYAEAPMAMAAMAGQSTGGGSVLRGAATVSSTHGDAPPSATGSGAGYSSGSAVGRYESSASRAAQPSPLRPLLLQGDEVVVMIPRGLSPTERRTLTRRTHVRVVFVEEEQAGMYFTEEQDPGYPIAQAGD